MDARYNHWVNICLVYTQNRQSIKVDQVSDHSYLVYGGPEIRQQNLADMAYVVTQTFNRWISVQRLFYFS